MYQYKQCILLRIILLSLSDITAILDVYGITITGVLHVGAHECEELIIYHKMKIPLTAIIWIDAIPEKVSEGFQRGIPNVYHGVITDKDDEDVVFNISNNGQSSSVLEFGTHLTEHPQVHYVRTLHQKSITIDTFFTRNNIDPSKYTFWNFDIQGAELMALRGAINSIQHAKVLYLEVNERELYKNCGMITEIDSFLASYKFIRVLTNMTEHGWGDALYIKIE